MEISTVSLRKVEGSWNATRNVPNFSYPEHGEIGSGLAKRLADYAACQLTESGFGPILADARCEVLTVDADMPAQDRAYQVTFTTPAGGSLSVDHILTSRGWPILDHGFSANRA